MPLACIAHACAICKPMQNASAHTYAATIDFCNGFIGIDCQLLGRSVSSQVRYVITVLLTTAT